MGGSEGRASEQGVRLDAQAALDYLRTHRSTEIDTSRIVLLGHSLGGAVAIDLAARGENWKKIAGLIVENTFLSIAKIIQYRVPGTAWVRPFLFSNWDSEVKIRELGAHSALPILFLCGDRDDTVPPQHMAQLYSIAKHGSLSSPKDHIEFFTLQGCGHTDTDTKARYFKRIAEFLQKI